MKADDGRRKTRKGATHVVNPTFKSIPGKVSPAEYRRASKKKRRAAQKRRLTLRRKKLLGG